MAGNHESHLRFGGPAVTEDRGLDEIPPDISNISTAGAVASVAASAVPSFPLLATT